MTTNQRLIGWAAAAAAVLATPVLLLAKTAAAPDDRTHLVETYGKVPMTFEANAGQTDPRVAFLSRGSGYALFLTPKEAVLSLREGSRAGERDPFKREAPEKPSRSAVLRLRCRGANPSPRVSGIDPQATRSNYFIGNDPARWRTGVPHFGKVRYEEVYPGIDLVYYGHQRQLEYDFVVKPGADPRKISLDFAGADKLATDANGDLVVRVGGGELRQHKPIAYQERDGKREPVIASYVVDGRRGAAFRLGDYDRSRSLVIDPVLVYSTYLGGAGEDSGYRIAVDDSGCAYVTGWTASTNFPTVGGVQSSSAGGAYDVFVTKLHASGSVLVYSTYIGGGSEDKGYDIAVDPSGNAYVVGWTGSTDFPTANALQSAPAGGGQDAFLAKLNAAGSTLVYSTYLGGSGTDAGNGVAVDSAGNAYVAGSTISPDFPVVNPFQGGFAGARDTFVAKLNPAGSALVYSTYLGGSSEEAPRGIALDGLGSVHVVGVTRSTDFPTANPIQGANAGGFEDAFITKLNAAGSALVYSTYLGGAGEDTAYGIAADGSGSAYVVGFTASGNFPTANALQGSMAGGSDAFAAKLNASGSVVYSTYLGGSDSDVAVGVAADGSANAYIVGQTYSTNFPTANPIQGTNAGGGDAFVVKLNPTGSALVYSTYLGGSGGDVGVGVAAHGGTAFVAGYASSTDFPTVNPFQAANAGDADAFVARISEDLIFKDGFE